MNMFQIIAVCQGRCGDQRVIRERLVADLNVFVLRLAGLLNETLKMEAFLKSRA